jgi:hypothetical protein
MDEEIELQLCSSEAANPSYPLLVEKGIGGSAYFRAILLY